MLTSREIRQVKDKKVKSILKKSQQQHLESAYITKKTQQYFQPNRSGFIQAEGPFEKTLKVTQNEIKNVVPISAANKVNYCNF